MTLFAHVEMAGKPGGGISQREATGNGPVTVHVGIAPGNERPTALKIVVQPSGDYTIENVRSDGSRGWLSFFARAATGSKRTVRFKRRRVVGRLTDAA